MNATRLLNFALLATLAFASPSLAAQKWSENDVEKTNRVDLVRLSHDVAFGSEVSVNDLPASSLRELAAFLANRKIGQYDELTVDAPLTADGQLSRLDQQRRDALAKFLRGRGLALKDAITPYGAAPKSGVIRLVVGRYVVTTPTCADWSQPSGSNRKNRPSHNLGCSNERALGQMIANPRDLIEGREFDGPDATVAAKAVQNYREGRAGAYPVAPNGSILATPASPRAGSTPATNK